MNETQILEKLTTVFRQVFDDEAVVAKPEMIVSVEETFGLRIPMREVVGLKNVGDLVKVIQAKL